MHFKQCRLWGCVAAAGAMLCGGPAVTAPVPPTTGPQHITPVPVTPVRVLLERDSDALLIRSPQATLYARYGQPASWRKLGREARIQVLGGAAGPRLTMNNVTVSSPLYLRGGRRIDDSFEISDERFRGALKVSAAGDRLLVANVLPIEDYLVATVGAEMVPSWELEALKAQAVASRTYALYMTEHPRDDAYDVERTTNDQVYGDLRLASPRVREAVASTGGEYLAVNGRAIKAYYHSRCGGATDAARDVWRTREAGLQSSVPCPYCRNHPLAWTTKISFPDLAQALELSLPPTFRVRLAEAGRSPGGRLTDVDLAAGGIDRRLTAEVLRKRLGYRRLKSTRFSWQIEPDGVRFRGEGAGHGVGMCQWGAQYLARLGKGYREILAHYYPSAQLLK